MEIIYFLSLCKMHANQNRKNFVYFIKGDYFFLTRVFMTVFNQRTGTAELKIAQVILDAK